MYIYTIAGYVSVLKQNKFFWLLFSVYVWNVYTGRRKKFPNVAVLQRFVLKYTDWSWINNL